jgi:Uma2 family endonuclease
MTLADFLAWEEKQALRYEFDGFRAIAKTGGTAAHAAIQRNLIYAVGKSLLQSPCQLHGSLLKIKVAEHIRYPDAFVVCTPVPPRSTVVSDPVVIFEIVSPSSITTDFVIKNAEYRATPSVQRYVVLQQNKAEAAVFFRKGDDWVSDPRSGGGAVLQMPEIGIEIPFSEIYRGVVLEPEEREDA